MRKLLLLCVALFGFYGLYAQVTDDLFQQKSSLSKDYHNIASKYEALQVNRQKLTTLKQQSLEKIELSIPFENKQLKLSLKKVSITAENFSVIEALPNGTRKTIAYNDGIFYQGKIEGRNKSFATISLFNNEVVGIIADEKSNIVIGSIQKNGNASDEYAMYRETDLAIPNPLGCATSDTPVDGPITNAPPSTSRVAQVGEPIDIYFECDFKFYQDKGSNTNNVINYVLGFFNNTAQLYANESIKIQVSQILVWTTQDPEAASGLNTTSAILPAFATRMSSTTYIGDYAHFLSTRSVGGGIAYLLNNPCLSSKANRTGVSGIFNTYSDFPTYSWTVEVVTHELGHNLGSPHTHSCTWPGGAIDWCGPTANAAYIEGSCASPGLPTAGGTIMSYCHLLSVGINFNNGFGPLPGDKIRSVIGAASCFGNCRMTISIAKTDASCSANNGSATVTAVDGTGALTYTWSDGQTGATLSNVGPGTYNVTVKDAATPGCQVMGVVTIINSGATLNATISPSATTSICTGGSVVLTATSNAAYSYQWSKNGVAITGATANTYTANSTGTYSVFISSGPCSVTKSVEVNLVTSPTANVTAGSATSFCSGNSVLLNGDAGAGYTYQWYNNGVAISGATNPTYLATASGNYTVKVSAGTCEATSTGLAVTVTPSPTATVTAESAQSFCAGGSVNLKANVVANYSYQWYKNGAIITGAVNSTYTATTSGNYTVTATSGGCSTTSSGTLVTVWVNPVVVVTPVTSTIQKFQQQTLTATGAVTYDWVNQPGYVSSTTNSAIYKPLTATVYTITGTDNNLCKGTATATIIVIGCGDATNITATTNSPSRVLITWINPAGATTDTLQYRKTGTTIWSKVFVTGQEYELNGLEPGANYEYNVIPLCTTTTVFIPSATQTFSTPSLTSEVYIRLMPNPVTANSRLEIIVDKPYTLQVVAYNNLGQPVMNVGTSQTLAAGQTIRSINASRLSTGIYTIVATINGKKYNVRMVVVK